MIYILNYSCFRYIKDSNVPAAYAYVGLASPGEAGSWEKETKVCFSNQCNFLNKLRVMRH